MSLWQTTHDYFKRNDVSGAISELEKFLTNNDSKYFSCLVGSCFSNSSTSVLAELNRFIKANENKFPVRSMYLEMNGFDINYDRWYFDFFAYSQYIEDFDEIDWLSDWQSDTWPELELSGMSAAQEAFAWYHENRIWKTQPGLKPVYEAAMLLVMAKFAAFVGSVLKSGPLAKPIPVLATAHDFESVVRYEP